MTSASDETSPAVSPSEAGRALQRSARCRPPKDLRVRVKIDARTRAGHVVADLKTSLLTQLGNRPSAAALALVEHLLHLKLRLLTMDETFLETGAMSAEDSQIYLAWSNSYVEGLGQFGLTLPDHSSERASVEPASKTNLKHRWLLDALQRWWLDVLQRGYIYESKLGLSDVFHVWHQKISMELLLKSSCDYVERKRGDYLLDRKVLGQFLHKMSNGRHLKLFKSIIGEELRGDLDRTNVRGTPIIATRVYGYQFNTLDQERAAFDQATGQQHEWRGLPAIATDEELPSTPPTRPYRRHHIAGGSDRRQLLSDVTQSTRRVILKSEVRANYAPFSVMHLDRLERAGKFPKRVYLSDNRVGWWEDEVIAWVESKRAAPAP